MLNGPNKAALKQQKYEEKLRREAEQAAWNEILQTIENRKAISRKLTRFYTKEKPASGEGFLSKFAHINELNAEGLAFSGMIDLFCLAVEFLFNLPYRNSLKQLDSLLDAELSALKQGRIVELVYRPGMTLYAHDAKGNLMNEELDVNELTDEELDEAIIANGLRRNHHLDPEAFNKGLVQAFDNHYARMYGASSLSHSQMLRMRGVVEAADHAMRNTVASDLASRRMLTKGK